MMDALKNNRVEFVNLLLENGVSMSRFLTTERLEVLYKAVSRDENTLIYSQEFAFITPCFLNVFPEVMFCLSCRERGLRQVLFLGKWLEKKR